MNKPKEYLVTVKQANMWPSKVTSGQCFTIVLKDLETQQQYKTWPDTSFPSFGAWNVLKENDIITDVSVYDEQKKILSSTNTPRVVGHFNKETEGQTSLLNEDENDGSK